MGSTQFFNPWVNPADLDSTNEGQPQDSFSASRRQESRTVLNYILGDIFKGIFPVWFFGSWAVSSMCGMWRQGKGGRVCPPSGKKVKHRLKH